MIETKIQQKDAHDARRPSVTVRIERGHATARNYSFTHDFRIGREKTCEISFKDENVSRVHAEVEFENGRWWLLDRESTNGVFKDGKKIEKIPVKGKTSIVLGVGGPRIVFEVEGQPEPESTDGTAMPSLTEYKKHYFGQETTSGGGEHTQMVRKAFREVNKKQKKKFSGIIGVVSVFFVIAAGYAFYKHQQVLTTEKLASDIFYQLKELELSQQRLEEQALITGDPRSSQELTRSKSRHSELMKDYNRLVEELGVYKGLSEEERTIVHIARVFGECEITLPSEFISRVEEYINEWRKSGRMRRALARAREKGYTTRISQAMLENHLPPHFIFLALQESDLDPEKVGPETRFGIAKGMWQFIPTTARQYGLKTGPLVHLAMTDPQDERHDFEKSTTAAARYLRDIYSTEAQASGFLVIASYNWGHNAVRGLIREMPANPRSRNFWNFLNTYRDRIPKETYNYVFYIISAAVIGEKPELFGFQIQPPLAPTTTE